MTDLLEPPRALAARNTLPARRAWRAWGLALGLAAALPCHGATGATPDAVFVELGGYARDKAATLGLTWDTGPHELFSHPLRLYWELALGRWRADAWHGMPAEGATRLGVTPVLRVPGASGRLFFEAGIGLNVISPHYRSDDERFSTHFNFGDHLGVGLAFGPGLAHELALRVQHFSNATIKKPNPGANFIELRYSVRLGDGRP